LLRRAEFTDYQWDELDERGYLGGDDEHVDGDQ
jgi:hypothetical protein